MHRPLCPRCRGKMYPETDSFGKSQVCMCCGYNDDVEHIPDSIRATVALTLNDDTNRIRLREPKF